MDSRLEKALQFSNYRTTLYAQLENLKLKTQNDLMYSHNGGTFEITRDLISFCYALMGDDQSDTVLLDVNDLPILISDLKTFTDDIYSKYFEAMNEYYVEYEKLRKARKVSAIVDLAPEADNEL